MNKKTKSIIVVAGPTAVGKTKLSIELANYFNTVILSADSRQFYKELMLGTAKPNHEELSLAKHYFINSLSIHDSYDVGKYEKEALQLLDELFGFHDVVVVTGGSGLYIKALCEGMDEMPEVSFEIRGKWNKIFAEEGIEFLQSKLQLVDKEYYQIVDENNPMRLIRALEVYDASGKNMTYWRSQKQNIDRPFQIIKLGINRERAILYNRIDERMDQMIDLGLFEEAKEFYHLRHLNALQTVGYSEIFGYLAGDYDREEAIRLLKRNSRRYAKRQLTWFKKDTEYNWFHPDEIDTIKSFINGQLIR